jgi:hypothetical protein
MSTQSFVNALIGLAREYKMKSRRAMKSKRPMGPPAFGADITEQMVESGYFNAIDAQVFGDAVEVVLQSSDPRREKQGRGTRT